MDKRTFLIAALIWPLLACTPREAPSLIGLWHSVAGTTGDGQAVADADNSEMEFRADGTLLLTLVDPPNGITSPTTLRLKYEIRAGNVLAYWLEGGPEEPHRFTIQGNRLDLEHLEHGIRTEWVRIDKTRFPGTPQGSGVSI